MAIPGAKPSKRGLTPEDWRRVGELFHQALELPAGERTAWAAGIGQSEPEIGHELLSLLESDRAAGEASFRDALSPRSSLSTRRVRPRNPAGSDRTAWCANWAAAAWALSIWPTATTSSTRRASPSSWCGRGWTPISSCSVSGGNARSGAAAAPAHRPAAGRRRHRGWPAVYRDGVHRRRLDQRALRAALGTEKRLRLFLDVCSAVEYAHRHFVVHRDIKPGNILVDDAGSAKLLDFGICKLLHAGPGARETMDTGAAC